MIRHIFRKDLRLLWPGIVVVAVVQAANAWLQVIADPFADSPAWIPAAALTAFGLISILLLVASLMHQDALAGIEHDWRVRPVRRRHLLLAKLLFILVAIHGPLFIVDVIEGIAFGFPVPACVRSALLRGIAVLCLLTLPAAAFATLTRGVTGVVAGAVTYIAGVVAFSIIVTAVGAPPPSLPVDSAFRWILTGATAALGLFAAAGVLLLRFFRRGTFGAYAAIVCVFALAILVPYLPWRAMFAVQQWVSPPPPQAGDSISLAFDTSHRGLVQPHATSLRPNGLVSVLLPLKISGLPADTILQVDNVEVRVVAKDGSTVYSGDNRCIRLPGNGLDCSNNIKWRGNGRLATSHVFRIPAEIYSRVKDEPVRIEMEYFLTILKLDAAHTLPLHSQIRRLSGMGWCAIRAEAGHYGVALKCVDAARAAPCVVALLVDNSRGGRRSETDMCRPDYAPWDFNIIPDAMTRFRHGGFVPVESFDSEMGHWRERLASPSHIILKSYQPQTHFTRKVVASHIRLSDWLPTRPGTAPAPLHEQANWVLGTARIPTGSVTQISPLRD